VIARGATLRVAAAREDGVITLEASGSPGAVLPVLSRIEAQLRAAVPGVTAVRLAAASPGPACAENLIRPGGSGYSGFGGGRGSWLLSGGPLAAA